MESIIFIIDINDLLIITRPQEPISDSETGADAGSKYGSPTDHQRHYTSCRRRFSSIRKEDADWRHRRRIDCILKFR